MNSQFENNTSPEQELTTLTLEQLLELNIKPREHAGYNVFIIRNAAYGTAWSGGAFDSPQWQHGV